MIEVLRQAQHRDCILPRIGSRKLPAFRFFLRYPLFLLAFGPPEFKPPLVGIDTSQAHFDFWNVIQVGWLSAIALRALYRLAGAGSIVMPGQIRSIFKTAFLLGLLFAISVAYSPGRVISGEYCVLFFLNLLCMVEFVAASRRDPPDWMQCLFQLRLVAFLLTATVLLTFLADPILVLHADGRLMGGSIASMPFCGPMIVVISAYTFLHSLERRMRAALYSLVGAACTLATRSRGVEFAVSLILVAMIVRWGGTNKRCAYLGISGFMAVTLFVSVLLGVLGFDPIWQAFNRGQDASTIVTASGRTGVWEDQVVYCLTHPQGMGYIAGVRAFRRRDYATNLHAALTNIGGTDNSYMEVLTDAGWLALLLYGMFLCETLVLGWRFAKREVGLERTDPGLYHLFNCALFMMAFCLAEGLESSKYVIPLFGPFYAQSILIAVLLAASGHVLLCSQLKPNRITR